MTENGTDGILAFFERKASGRMEFVARETRERRSETKR